MTKQTEIMALIKKTEEEQVIAKKALSNASCAYKKNKSILDKCYKDLFLLGPEIVTPPATSVKK